MAIVYIKPGENFESSIRKFRKEVEREGILKELKERQYYKKPSLIRKDEFVKLKKKLRKRTRFSKSTAPRFARSRNSY